MGGLAEPSHPERPGWVADPTSQRGAAAQRGEVTGEGTTCEPGPPQAAPTSPSRHLPDGGGRNRPLQPALAMGGGGGGWLGQEGEGQTCSGGRGGRVATWQSDALRGAALWGRPLSGSSQQTSEPCGILGAFSTGPPEPARGPCRLLPSATVRPSVHPPIRPRIYPALPVLCSPPPPPTHPAARPSQHTLPGACPVSARAWAGGGSQGPRGEVLTPSSTGDLG